MNVDPLNLDPEESENIAGPELPDHLIAKLRVSIPGYELLDKIDTGGQATVYRAKELTSGLTVAIKVLNGGPNANADARDRLLREAAALRALNHPNIVCVIEAGRTSIGLDFIAMNYVDGRPLDALWTDREFSAAIAPEPPARLRLFKRICDIVQSAHLKGITHRDLSPSNILITADGEPHILDFGLASTAFDDLLSPAGRQVTVTGQFIGKVKYASPEQARGQRDTIDIRTDVYALGVILYQILTDGAFPYQVVGALVDVLNHIIHTQPLPPSTALQDRASARATEPVLQNDPRLVNETIEAVVLKALEKNPADRYQSAGALAADIHEYLDGRPTAALPRDRKIARPIRPGRQRRLVTALVIITILSGILMNIRTILTWLGLTIMTASLGAGPAAEKGGASHAAPIARPGPRLRPRIGAAPKAEFHSGGHTYKIDSKEHSVAAVRAMPPRNFEPATRKRTVDTFYHEQIAKDVPARERLDRLCVGPFRHEFVWWAWHHWGLHDRAWWAWNNYAYFDAALWQEWMLDHDFAQMIAQFDSAHKQRVLGFIPDAYASQAVEIIYSDEYIDAVYNPTPTPPSIVVDSTASVQLSNLLEGTTRVFGKKTLAIGILNDNIRRYQFISLPADFDPTYQIDVKRDGDLYVFGPSITPANEAFGADAAKWVPVANQITGPGIQIVYQRQVKAGEKIHLHGVEWSIASEQIELFSPASPEALAAARHVVRDLEQMNAKKGDFVQANPSLADYLQESHDVAVQLVTANNNVNDDAVADCHYELDHLQKMAAEDLNGTSDPRVASVGRDFVRRVQSLRESLNAMDDSSDDSSPDQMPVADVGVVDHDQPTEQSGLLAQYFGSSDFKVPVNSRIDPDINFQWARGEPPVSGCPTPKYSVRWTGEIMIPEGGVTAISADVDDGCRLFIDGVKLININKPGSAMSSTPLGAGLHMIVVEYWNERAEGLIKLKWIPSGKEQQTIPASAFSHKVLKAELKITGTGVGPGDLVAPNPSASVEIKLRTIDLLKMVDPAQDTAHGRWEINGQGLFGAGGEKWCEIAFPYIPPSEYDYKIVFVRNSGDEPFCQLFVGGVHRIAWWIGKENTKAYFSPVTNWDKGVKAVKSTERIRENWIMNGQEYTSILRVRKDGVEALLNGESVCKWPTDYVDLKSNGWPIGKDGTIQVGFNGLHSTYTIKSAEVTGISGTGEPKR